jgi:hypothetical protein
MATTTSGPAPGRPDLPSWRRQVVIGRELNRLAARRPAVAHVGGIGREHQGLLQRTHSFLAIVNLLILLKERADLAFEHGTSADRHPRWRSCRDGMVAD